MTGKNDWMFDGCTASGESLEVTFKQSAENWSAIMAHPREFVEGLSQACEQAQRQVAAGTLPVFALNIITLGDTSVHVMVQAPMCCP